MEKKLIYGAEDTYPNQREDFRIDDTLPLIYSPLGETNRREEESSIHDITPILRKLKKRDMDPELLLLIKLFDEKLNQIIKLTSGKDSGGYLAGKAPIPTDINISAGGISFRSKESFKVGEVLNLVIGLPPQPYTHINIVGEVLRVSEVDGAAEDEMKFNVALKFVHMDDEERQDITKYLFDVQRKRVRSHKDI